MTTAVPSPQAAPRLVAIAVESAAAAADLEAALTTRGVTAERVSGVPEALARPCAATAFAPARPIDAATAAALAPLCSRAASQGRPVVVLSVFEPPSRRGAAEREAATALLESHGAIVCRDPNVWLEAIVLCTAFGLPTGPHVAVVAPPGTWLALSATALANERTNAGERNGDLLVGAADAVGTVDAALIHTDELPSAGQAATRAMLVPLTTSARPPHPGSAPALCGVREALAAVRLCGTASRRIAAGLGPCPPEDIDGDVDQARFDRQLEQLDARAGDHETKVLLASYSVPITRQAVATTPSGATRIAKRAGWPVQVKPWSPDAPTETAGCPVETDLNSAPEVRRAFAAVASAANLPSGAPVIVRETPPQGRWASVRFTRLGALGWTCLVDVDGTPGPLAAPAPLRAIDAEKLSAAVEATRADDPVPDRASFATLLQRASRLVVERSDDIDELLLPRVVIGGEGAGAVVVDARASLKPR